MSPASPSLSERVIRRVAERKGIAPTELDQPLHEVIDPDALDALFTPLRSGQTERNGRVTFPYSGFVVTVYSDGEVEIRSP